jgi:hypothetical protein
LDRQSGSSESDAPSSNPGVTKNEKEKKEKKNLP